MSREIRMQRRQIEKARSDKIKEAMQEYDDTVFYPALAALKSVCGEAGHGAKRPHDNGLGWVFVYCADCGGLIERHGPNGEVVKP